MTGLELLKAPETTASEIADIISAPCPPTIPAHCDGVSCRECWLTWLTGEPIKEKEPPDKRTAPDEEGLHPNLVAFLRQRKHLLGVLEDVKDDVIGIQEVGRSLPYQPWDKPIERFFSTVCSKFSKWFESYTGTLTGSKTYAKRQKDIDQMLERGELLTMEEFFEVWTEWKNTKYHTRKHRGLSDAGEKWVTPIEMFENGPRYEKAAPPREYAAMLLMKAATARVTNQGINKFGTLYTDTELAYYVNQKVNIKWDIDDVTKLYVYDMEGKKICEAVSAELLAFGPHCSQAALEKHLRDQKRNEREVREYLEERVRPYELRLEDGARPSDAVGMIDLTIKATPSQKLVSLPKDRMFRSEQASKASRKKVTDDTFLNAKGDKALSLLRAMNE